MQDGVFEFADGTRLTGDSSILCRIPIGVMELSRSCPKATSVFCALFMRKGLAGEIAFSSNMLVSWLGLKPDRHEGGSNDKVSKAVDALATAGYVKVGGRLSNSSVVEAVFSTDKVFKECDEGHFSKVYYDEFKKICLHGGSKDSDSMLRVLSWLRVRVPWRRNRLMPEDVADGVERRRRLFPEAYDGYFKDMAEELGMSERVVSKAVSSLEDIGILHCERLPNVSCDGKWRTGRVIICNAYKRDAGMLLASGREYYDKEIEYKKMRIFEMDWK